MDVEKRTCLYCGDVLSTEELLCGHIKSHHTGYKQIKCLICKHTSSTKSKCFSHYCEYHEKYPFKCSKCLYKTNVMANLRSHQVCHWSKGTFKCTQCSYSGDIPGNVVKHELNYH